MIHRKQKTIYILGILCFACLPLLLTSLSLALPQEQSGICTADDKDMSAKDFCEKLKAATANGAKQIVMINGQCFGGGFSCITTIGTSSSIFMKSASADTEPSITGGNDRAWVSDVRDGFNNGLSVFAADTYANAKDPFGPFGSDEEHPQKAYSSGDAGASGATLTSGATSFHAILFAGLTTGRPDYAKELDQWYSMLTAKGYEVTKLIGGTRDDLENALSTVSSKMNSQEDLIVVIYDHGTPMAIDTTPQTVVSAVTVTITLSSTFGMGAGKADKVPKLIISAIDTGAPPGQVFFDGQPIGQLTTSMSPSPVKTYLDVYVDLTTSAPKVEIRNPTPTIPIEILELRLTGGPVPTLPYGIRTSQHLIPPFTSFFERLGPGVSMRFTGTGPSGVTTRVIKYDSPPPTPGSYTFLPHYWDISTVSNDNISGVLALEYNLKDVRTLNLDENSLFIARSTTGGLTWDQLSTKPNTFLRQVRAIINGFSLYAIGGIPLPVELSAFKAEYEAIEENSRSELVK